MGIGGHANEREKTNQVEYKFREKIISNGTIKTLKVCIKSLEIVNVTCYISKINYKRNSKNKDGN